MIEFDNLTSDIVPHKSLCSALTAEFITGRILGLSKTATVSTRALFLSSGNNVTPIKDMTRRCITINFNPEVEIPAARKVTAEINCVRLTYRHQSKNDYWINRDYTISINWTLIRNWHV